MLQFFSFYWQLTSGQGRTPGSKAAAAASGIGLRAADAPPAGPLGQWGPTEAPTWWYISLSVLGSIMVVLSLLCGRGGEAESLSLT